MSAENPADTVTEAAAKVGAEAIYWTLEWEQLDDETRSDATEFARALHDAGLLVDPADRDANTRVAARNALEWRMVARKNEDRAERAEAERDQLHRWKAEATPVILGLQDLGLALGIPLGANITGQDAADAAAALVAERDELRATVTRVATLRDRWAILAGQATDADNRAWLNAASKTLRTVLDTAGGEQQ